ncbi:hypothetical protein KVV02_007940 [Mortierella alpina]|uniref:Attractin/MKLN-like beta-propeller domain-containing protein n=1 Tax=Mortierella alpina TaxID=64518 RepID=A0A9P8CW32_MORAP|nr:hypothetical protein KVV02_007940 [Mortierella alpina]
MRFSHSTRSLASLLFLYYVLAGAFLYAEAQPQPCGGAAYAKVGNSFYIQGGATSGDNLLQPFWALDLTTTWTTSQPAWKPLPLGPANAYHSAGYSADNQSFITFGRDTAADPQVIPQNWINVYNIATRTWSFSSNPPNMADNSRRDFNVVTNPRSNKIYILGGDAGPGGAIWSNMFNIYDPTTRTLTEITTPPPGPQNVATYAAVWVPRLNAMVVIGGNYMSGAAISGLYLYHSDTGSWTTQATTGAFNYARYSHCAASNADGSLIAVYGGFTGHGGGDPNVYLLNTVTWTWTSTIYPGRGRGNAACAIVDDTFIVWGGFYSSPNTLNGTPMGTEALLLFSLSKRTWETTYTPSAALSSGDQGGSGGAGSSGAGGGGSGNNYTNPEGNESGGISKGAIGGIVAGGLGVLFVAAFAVFERSRRKKKRHESEKQDPDMMESTIGQGHGYNHPNLDENQFHHQQLGLPRPTPQHPSGKYQPLSPSHEPLSGISRPSLEGYNSSNGFSNPTTPTALQFLNTSEQIIGPDGQYITAAGAGAGGHYIHGRHSYQSDGTTGSAYYPRPSPTTQQQQPIACENVPYRQSFAHSNSSFDRRSNDPHAIINPTTQAHTSAYYPYGNVSSTASGAGISSATTAVDQYHDGGYGKHTSLLSGYSDTPPSSHSQSPFLHDPRLSPPPPPIPKRPVSGPQGGSGFGSASGQPVPGAPHAILQHHHSPQQLYQPPLSPRP